MKSEERGQVSIEFILVVGAIAIMTLVGIPFILKNAEMNRGLSAARDGATKGAAVRGLGFSSTGGNEAGQVKIINFTVTVIESGSIDNVSITITADVPDNMDGTSVCDTIETQSQRHVAHALTGDWPTGAVVSIAIRTGSYYRFAPIGCVEAP